MCRLYSEHPETVEHLICGCAYLASLQYKHWHDEVAKYLHWLLCGKYELERDAVWWKCSPFLILENEMWNCYWDFNIYTTRPYIAAIEKLDNLFI